MGLSTAKLNSCKWQVFGIRLLLLVLYLPVEFLLLIVVKRHTSDSTFNIRLKEALAKGEGELIAFIEEQRIHLKEEKSDKKLKNVIHKIKEQREPKFSTRLRDNRLDDSIDLGKDPN